MNPNLIAVENKIVRVLSIQPECLITHPTELAALKSMSPDELEEFALDNGWVRCLPARRTTNRILQRRRGAIGERDLESRSSRAKSRDPEAESLRYL